MFEILKRDGLARICRFDTKRGALETPVLLPVLNPRLITIPPSVVGAFDENGMLHIPKMLGRALLRPIDFPGVIRLGRHFGAAMKTLHQVATVARDNNFAVL